MSIILQIYNTKTYNRVQFKYTFITNKKVVKTNKKNTKTIKNNIRSHVT